MPCTHVLQLRAVGPTLPWFSPLRRVMLRFLVLHVLSLTTLKEGLLAPGLCVVERNHSVVSSTAYQRPLVKLPHSLTVITLRRTPWAITLHTAAEHK